MNKTWKVPSREDQDALRGRLTALLERNPISATKIATGAKLSLMTVRGFMQQDKNLDWVNWKKLSLFLDKCATE